MNNDEINPELESFRRQWQEEVRSKNPGARNQDVSTATASGSTAPRPARSSGPPGHAHVAARKKPSKPDGDEDHVPAVAFGEPEPSVSPSHGPSDAGHGKGKEPILPGTALEHYEEAVETEGQGNLGEALRLYRKAFRVSHSPSWSSLPPCHHPFPRNSATSVAR